MGPVARRQRQQRAARQPHQRVHLRQRRRRAVQHADLGGRFAEHHLPRPEQARDGAGGKGARAGPAVFGAERGGVHAEQGRQLGRHAIHQVGGAHQRQHGLLHPGGQTRGRAPGGEHAVGAGREALRMRPFLGQHGRHVVGELLAMQPARWLQHAVKLWIFGQPAGIGAQKGGHVARQDAILLHGQVVWGLIPDAAVFTRGVMSASFLLTTVQTPAVLRKRVPVLLPYPFAGPFDYAVPEGMDARPGDMVLVPLNRRAEVGVVWDAPFGDSVPDAKLKPIDALLDGPPMPPALRRFIDWVAGYTLAPPGDVLAMALRVNALAPPVPQAGWSLADLPADARLTDARRRVADLLAAGGPRTGSAIAREAGVSAGGWCAAWRRPGCCCQPCCPPPRLSWRRTRPIPARRFPPEQADAAAALRAAVSRRAFSVTLLDGVTGSGKTEVYLEAVATCLAEGRQALVLLPEIALSSQWLERFERRFGTAPGVWHSDLPSRVRRITWRAVAEGGAPVVVGARSALFLPFPDLGLVVVDEEHETAFKQEDGVVYHARDMAVVRARLSEAPAVLVSATPSLETQANVEAGRYQKLTLAARHGGATLPDVTAIDLREHPPERGHFLAEPLVAAIRDTIARGEQAMLFLNRRGYAPLTLCRACGHRMQCPNCTAWLVEHRARKLLTCHHCGHAEPIPPVCPVCSAENSLVPIGPGVERITEEATALFPTARLLVMASDTMPARTPRRPRRRPYRRARWI